jgi:hypothetical protein
VIIRVTKLTRATIGLLRFSGLCRVSGFIGMFIRELDYTRTGVIQGLMFLFWGCTRTAVKRELGLYED